MEVLDFWLHQISTIISLVIHTTNNLQIFQTILQMAQQQNNTSQMLQTLQKLNPIAQPSQNICIKGLSQNGSGDKNVSKTMTQIVSPTEQKPQALHPLSLTYSYIKFLHKKYTYQRRTLYFCLYLLNQIQNQLQPGKYQLYSAALFSIVAKVHQSKKPRFKDLVAWGKKKFTKYELIATQAHLFKYFDYCIPVFAEFSCGKQLNQQIARLSTALKQSQKIDIIE